MSTFRNDRQGIMIQRLGPFLFLASIIFLTILAYLPGLQGPYVLDDGENIVQNRAVAMQNLSLDSLHQALTSNESGPLKRPIAALSFAVNHYFAGSFDNPLPFKLTNLLIHLTNTVLVYILAVLLLRTPALQPVLNAATRRYAAGMVAAVWALHPLQLTSVLYVVQRMNSLSALFVLSGLIVFCHGRSRVARGDAGGFMLMYTGIGAGTLLGLGAKENAALLPLLALVIEHALFAVEPAVSTMRRQIRLFYVLTVLVPLGAFAAYLFLHPEFLLSAYDQRHFTLWERLLTEARVLLFYLGLLVLPDVRHFGLFHDDIRVSLGLFDPLTTLPAAISIIIFLALAAFRPSRFPLFSFGVLWFLAGHSLESSIFGLEIAYEHRNYLPSFGVLFVLVIAGWVSIQKRTRAPKFSAVLPAAVILVLAFVTWNRANTWSDIRHLAEDNARYHPASPRANDFAARVALGHERNAGKALRYIIAGARVAPFEAGFLIDMRILLTILFHDTNTASPLKPAAMPDQRNNPKMESKNGPRENGKLANMAREISDPQAITTLLRERPISVHTIVSIENLSACVLKQPHLCATLRDEALEWLTVAGDNTRTSPEYRAIIFSNAAKLHASVGDYLRAYDYINRAIDVMPTSLSYQLGRIEYLIRLNRLSEAGNLLANPDWSLTEADIELSSNRDAILRLKTLHEEKTKAFSHGDR